MRTSDISKTLIDEIRTCTGIFNYTFGEVEEYEIVPENKTHDYLLTNFKISESVIKYYFLPTSELLTDEEFNRITKWGYYGNKETLLMPYPLIIMGAYHSRTDLIRKLSEIAFLGLGHKINGKEVKFFYELEPYFKEYSEGFKQGFNNFENNEINQYLTPFADKTDFANKVFEYLTNKMPFVHNWMNHETGFTLSLVRNRIKESEIIKGFEKGLQQGYFYKAWYFIFSNNELFAPLFDSLTNVSEIAEPDEPEIQNESLKQNVLRQIISDKFYFTLTNDPRKHKQILSKEDFDNLVDWVFSFFQSDYRLPEINEPIKQVNTDKGNIIYTFKSLFNDLSPSQTYPETLFELIKLCFYQYRNDEISNLKKSKKPQYYDVLIKNANQS